MLEEKRVYHSGILFRYWLVYELIFMAVAEQQKKQEGKLQRWMLHELLKRILPQDEEQQPQEEPKEKPQEEPQEKDEKQPQDKSQQKSQEKPGKKAQEQPQEKDEEQPKQMPEEEPQKEPQEQPDGEDNEQPQEQLHEEQGAPLLTTLRNKLIPAAMGLTALCVIKAIIH
ncbi:putative uncharacterized protein DDB_G0290989 [Drosophila guanche]|uniref:Uncharacterized protein n=1 Tax=Drosophila guanche TaxID=7266 RepID=A0A3B0KRF1_DROGU|nr:putative uncharacterized protein DDB_G0290989 [Drosophila guanche]SPP89229.1 Hypothetical predicted protein [Drosophila guanche]